MSSIHKRVGAVLGTAALFVGVAFTAGAGTASADETGDLASDVDFSVSASGITGLTAMESDGSLAITVVSPTDHRTMGFARWNADPQPAPNIPGDSLVAKDTRSDGWGIEAELSTGRVASTRGHKAPYIAIASGNLPEGHAYKLRACVVKGSERQCSQWYAVRA
ncbi:hypothetical protein [Streptomyces nojiriensis]|uniref:hypothetical protein n=1 Tax=Streptomyces nojiriensis TaxID=66374 RepID=UPI0035D63E51